MEMQSSRAPAEWRRQSGAIHPPMILNAALDVDAAAAAAAMDAVPPPPGDNALVSAAAPPCLALRRHSLRRVLEIQRRQRPRWRRALLWHGRRTI